MLEPGSPVVIGVMPGLRPAVVECASEIAELLGGVPIVLSRWVRRFPAFGTLRAQSMLAPGPLPRPGARPYAPRVTPGKGPCRAGLNLNLSPSSTAWFMICESF